MTRETLLIGLVLGLVPVTGGCSGAAHSGAGNPSAAGMAGSSPEGGAAGKGAAGTGVEAAGSGTEAAGSGTGVAGSGQLPATPESGPDLNGYNPCPAKGTPCVVMPLGDSITQGLGAWTGYRGPLFHLANLDSKSMTYVGSQIDGPETVDDKPFPKLHEGHSGFTIDGAGGRPGIKQMVAGVMSQYKPNVITMMIGTNDVDLNVDNIPTRLAGLIDTILEADPKVLLVVAQIIPSGDDAQNVFVRQYNAAIPDIVRTRAAAGKHITFVDMYTPFVADPNFKVNNLGDELHPKYPGYIVMAEAYYSVLGPLLR